MRRLPLLLVLALLTVAVTAGWWRSGAGAQDSSGTVRERVDALETRVAALETAVAGSAGADPQPDTSDAGSSEGSAAQATEAADADAPRAAAGQGTRDDPIPFGTAAEVGDWTVSVVDVVPDATALVMGENQFNDPPPADSQFYLITLRATYNGTEPATFGFALSWSAVGESAASYGESEHSCGSIPDGVFGIPEVFEGGEVEGNICFAVRAEDVDSLVLYLSPLFSFDDDDDVFFALRPEN